MPCPAPGVRVSDPPALWDVIRRRRMTRAFRPDPLDLLQVGNGGRLQSVTTCRI